MAEKNYIFAWVIKEANEDLMSKDTLIGYSTLKKAKKARMRIYNHGLYPIYRIRIISAKGMHWTICDPNSNIITAGMFVAYNSLNKAKKVRAEFLDKIHHHLYPIRNIQIEIIQ